MLTIKDVFDSFYSSDYKFVNFTTSKNSIIIEKNSTEFMKLKYIWCLKALSYNLVDSTLNIEIKTEDFEYVKYFVNF